MTAASGGRLQELAAPAGLAAEPGATEITLRDALIEGARRIPGEAPRLEAEALLAGLLGRPRGWLLARLESPLSPHDREQFQAGLTRLEAGEPLAYILGRREFFGLEFSITPHVLVPRPETEL